MFGIVHLHASTFEEIMVYLSDRSAVVPGHADDSVPGEIFKHFDMMNRAFLSIIWLIFLAQRSGLLGRN